MAYLQNRFLITGATGLIGKAIVTRLLEQNVEKVVAVVRNMRRAKKIFGNSERIQYIEADIQTLSIQEYNVDYIIHAAANTSSKDFVENPLDIINTTIEGTRKMLEIARISHVKGFVFLSSMEVYGTPATDEKIDESHGTDLNTMAIRSCYPESKRLCENLCIAYQAQYGVPIKVVRLTQTFGPGVNYEDGRVFAEFARCVIENRNIILKTKGETKRSYLYTTDAADAILTVALKGKSGEAYNAANEETYCSIYEMAEMVSKRCANGKIEIIIDETEVSKMGYAPTLHMNLSTNKLKGLGWKPTVGLDVMFERMINDMKNVYK